MPAIRFKGFSGEWCQSKLGEIVIYIVDNRGKNPKYYCSYGIPVIDNFMIKNDSYPNLKVASRFIDEYLFNNFIRNYNELDDVLITLVGNNIGNITLFPNEKSVIIQNTLGLRFSNNKKFMFYSLLFKNKKIVHLDRGMAQPSIRQDELLGIEIELPLDETEQTKIGNYFQQLDTLIAQHQKKHDKLLNLKKSLLEKMFPKQGATKPEIRFQGFSGEWEENEFSAIVSRQTAMSNEAELPRVEYEDIVSGKGELNKDIWEKESSKTGIKFEYADVLFGKLRPYLKNWLLPNFEGVAVGDFWVLRASEKASEFVYFLIQTAAFEQAANLSSGSKMPRSDWGLVSKTVFRIPAQITEQTKIGNLFKQLDTLITQHQTQLKKLNNIKQACLEKMFV